MTNCMQRRYIHVAVMMLATSQRLMDDKDEDMCTDIHYDPFYASPYAIGSDFCQQTSNITTKYGRQGCDSPEVLIRQAFEEAQSQSSFDFILITGDFCRHGTDQLENPRNDTQSILYNVTQMLVQDFEDTRIVPSVGNNDFTPDYYLDLDNATDMLSMVSTGLGDLLETDDERATFFKGGYLACNVTDNIAIVSLNTIVYSSLHVPENQHDDDPLGQFAWLQQQLDMARASDRVVYIMGHIPPSVGSYRHSQLWKDQYLKKYYALLVPYQSLVRAQLFGHLHSDEFRLIQVADGAIFPLLLASSITPIYGSNPSIRIVHYEQDSGLILDYDTHYLNLTSGVSQQEWIRAPSFRESYPLVQNLSTTNLQLIVANLTNSSDSPLWEAVVSRQHVFANNPATSNDDCRDECKREWLCTIQSMSRNEFDICMKHSSTGSVIPMTVVGPLIGVVVVVVVVTFLCVLRRYHRRRHYQSNFQDGVVMTQQEEEGNDPSELDIRQIT